MSTNGKSASQWLKDNHSQVSIERVQQIITSLNAKIEAIPPEHPDYEGLLEALDVMDQHLLSRMADQNGPQSSQDAVDSGLDFSPLTPDADETAPTITPEEKTRRFKALLKTSDI